MSDFVGPYVEVHMAIGTTAEGGQTVIIEGAKVDPETKEIAKLPTVAAVNVALRGVGILVEAALPPEQPQSLIVAAPAGMKVPTSRPS